MKNNLLSKVEKFLAIGLILSLVIFASIIYVSAAPQGATVVGTPSVDNGPTTNPSNRTDPGGKIVTIVFSLEQQNTAWKAYVGNVSGTYVLQSANGRSIYEWPSGTSIQGELYLSRNNTVNFSSIICANSTIIGSEQNTLGMAFSDSDSINRTFNSTRHRTFNVGTVTITNSTCQSTATWVNDTVQAQDENAVFQEVLLYDRTNMVYASLLNDNNQGFDNSSSFDFQAIVGENRTSVTGSPYYFYLELGN